MVMIIRLIKMSELDFTAYSASVCDIKEFVPTVSDGYYYA